MAYMSQENKKLIAAALKIAMKGTGITYTLAVKHHSTIVMNIKSGPVDFMLNAEEIVLSKPRAPGAYAYVRPKALQVNSYWYKEQFTGRALAILEKAIPVLNTGNHDNSDAQSDYFDVGWYVDVNIGHWDAPYQVIQ